jgi:all-trans-8'-apo-beta-carotenal 15,15'-oxygenase
MTAIDLKSTNEPSYTLEAWRGGYQSLKDEHDYWIDQIEGEIPPDLTGTLFRNGPGMLDIDGDRLHHPFDGDGMICAFTFKDSQVHFRNRYVKTEGYLAEQKAKKILYRGVFGTQKPGGWLANIFDVRLKNIANTNIVYWGQKLLALWEAGLPHRLNPSTLETEGVDQLDGLLGKSQPFSAHPQWDPGDDKREARFVNFSTETTLSTKLTVYEFDLEGQLKDHYVHQIPGLGFFHDFALTPHYAIFFQNPVVLNPIPFTLGLLSAGQSLHFRADQPTKVWIIPRNGKDPVQVLETEACFVFHHVNAFETETGISVDSVCYSHFPKLGPDDDFNNVDFDNYPMGQIWRYHINLTDPKVTREMINPRCCEFPALNPKSAGKPYRYLFIGAAQSQTENQPLQVIQKLDLQTQTQEDWFAGTNRFIGEPLFISKPGSDREDGGWLLTLTYNGNDDRSELVILDGEDMSKGAIAKLKLKHHIPYGLHGCFTPEVFR